MKSGGSSVKEFVAVARVAAPDIARPIRRDAASARGFYRRAGKRLLDICLAIPLLVLSVPIIVVAAVAVVLTSGWPPFYRARRVGKDGREFSMWKLRTMRHDAEAELERWRVTEPQLIRGYERDFKLKDDPRVTRFGRFLRQSSFDELPQLWNVALGEMSLVGYRPIVKSELVHYAASLSEFLSMRPGITGSWQLGGRNKLTYPERAAVELDYLYTCGLGTDLRILLRTLLVPLKFTGV